MAFWRNSGGILAEVWRNSGGSAGGSLVEFWRKSGGILAATLAEVWWHSGGSLAEVWWNFDMRQTEVSVYVYDFSRFRLDLIFSREYSYFFRLKFVEKTQKAPEIDHEQNP